MWHGLINSVYVYEGKKWQTPPTLFSVFIGGTTCSFPSVFVRYFRPVARVRPKYWLAEPSVPRPVLACSVLDFDVCFDFCARHHSSQACVWTACRCQTLQVRLTKVVAVVVLITSRWLSSCDFSVALPSAQTASLATLWRAAVLVVNSLALFLPAVVPSDEPIRSPFKSNKMVLRKLNPRVLLQLRSNVHLSKVSILVCWHFASRYTWTKLDHCFPNVVVLTLNFLQLNLSSGNLQGMSRTQKTVCFRVWNILKGCQFDRVNDFCLPQLLTAGGIFATGLGVCYALDQSAKAGDLALHPPHYPWSHNGLISSFDIAR